MIELRVQCAAGGARGIAQDGNTRNDASETEFCVHITRGALQNLALQPGQAVWLIIKTHSIQFLRS